MPNTVVASLRYTCLLLHIKLFLYVGIALYIKRALALAQPLTPNHEPLQQQCWRNIRRSWNRRRGSTSRSLSSRFTINPKQEVGCRAFGVYSRFSLHPRRPTTYLLNYVLQNSQPRRLITRTPCTKTSAGGPFAVPRIGSAVLPRGVGPRDSV